MSDEQEQRDEAAKRPAGPDDTRPMTPFADDDEATGVSENHPDGGPRSGDHPDRDGGPAPTEQMPRVAGSAATEQTGRSAERGLTATTRIPGTGPAAAPTEQIPGAAAAPTEQIPRTPRDATSIMPPVNADQNWGASDRAWSGRAEVRPPRPGDYDSTPDWSTERPSEPRGRWWMPILIGIIGLILIALLGWGIWLIFQAQSKNKGTTPTPPPTVATQPSSAPTTQASTQPPTTAPTTTEPAVQGVTIPALRGLSLEGARQALSRSGLAWRPKYVNSTAAPPGTVIDSDPAEGQEVPPDTVVTLVIVAQPSPTPTTPVTTGASRQAGR